MQYRTRLEVDQNMLDVMNTLCDEHGEGCDTDEVLFDEEVVGT